VVYYHVGYVLLLDSYGVMCACVNIVHLQFLCTKILYVKHFLHIQYGSLFQRGVYTFFLYFIACLLCV
jgi:hypothetical protein